VNAALLRLIIVRLIDEVIRSKIFVSPMQGVTGTERHLTCRKVSIEDLANNLSGAVQSGSTGPRSI
jgi:hypothetical protein